MSFKDLQAKHLPPCIYCGEPATTRDHVPPKSYSPFNTFTVPACWTCNSGILRDQILLTVEARKEYVQNELRRRAAIPAKVRLRAGGYKPKASRLPERAKRLGGTLDMAALKALRGAK